MLSEKHGSTMVIIVPTAIVVIVVIVLLSVSRDRGNYCMTHDNQTGVCVSRSVCDSNTDLLVRASTEVSLLSQQSQCDNFIYVCCAQNRVTQLKTEITPTKDQRSVEPYIHASVPKTDEEIQYGMAILLESECEDDAPSLAERPWMASLVYETDGTQRQCCGALITKQYVLTAAHCIHDSPKLISVRFGGNIGCTSQTCIQSSFQDIGIEEAIYHDNYTPDLVDDIGLIRLIRPVDTNYFVRPICLPMITELEDLKAQVCGWGVLKTAVVQVKDNGHCQRIFRLIRMTENMMCAQAGSNGTDGPMYLSLNYRRSKSSVQLGVLPPGNRVPGPSSSFVYSKITNYLPWIAGNIRP